MAGLGYVAETALLRVNHDVVGAAATARGKRVGVDPGAGGRRRPLI